jgi:hypothetical protein
MYRVEKSARGSSDRHMLPLHWVNNGGRGRPRHPAQNGSVWRSGCLPRVMGNLCTTHEHGRRSLKPRIQTLGKSQLPPKTLSTVQHATVGWNWLWSTNRQPSQVPQLLRTVAWPEKYSRCVPASTLICSRTDSKQVPGLVVAAPNPANATHWQSAARTIPPAIDHELVDESNHHPWGQVSTVRVCT